MAKQGRTGGLGMVAFIAIVVNAVCWLVIVLNNALKLGLPNRIPNVLSALASLALLIVVAIVAYDFAKHQSKGWRITYWVIVIISLCAVLFGVGVNFIR